MQSDRLNIDRPFGSGAPTPPPPPPVLPAGVAELERQLPSQIAVESRSGTHSGKGRVRSSWRSRLVTALAPRRTDRGPQSVISSTPPWLISMFLHTLLLLLLGLWFKPMLRSNVTQLTMTFAETLGEQLEIETLQIGPDPEEIAEPIVTPDVLPEVEQPLLAPPTPPMVAVGPTAASEVTIPDVGLALSGREPGMKSVLLAAYGGNALTEAAVTDALEWLKRNQRRDGTWDLTGPYRDGGQHSNPTSATAMAMLAFQGAGHTHQYGSYQDVMLRAHRALVKMQDADGDFWRGTVGHHRLYSQAQAMIAICELYGMTKDSQLRTAAERAVQYAARTQDRLGGWRYQPGYDSDTSVSGWFMMGLQSARMAHIEVPAETLDNLAAFLDRVASSDRARYGYQPGMEPTFSMTAEALLCRQYLGWSHDDPSMQTGVNMLLARPIDWNDRDVYYWYYATQVLHHLHGDSWDQWNRVMRQVLPEEQTREGAERGSWSPLGDRWGPHGGRLYVTCLCTYMLEVYYRHLPIYGLPSADSE